MFEDIFSLVADRLPTAGVDCLLIGGFAVNHYGYTRNTLDIDFMIIGTFSSTVRRMMLVAGFMNIDERDNVLFCSRLEGGPRVDFLKVNQETMQKLLANAHKVSVQGVALQLPCLKDLIAMKIFSLTQDTARRMAKDLPDIAYLAVLNDLDLKMDIKPLCDRFGTPIIYNMIYEQIEALK
jgi:hypothetical protein